VIGAGEVRAQVSFGGQVSVTNLGTDAAQVGETVGVGGRIGVGAWQRRTTRIVVEAVGDAFFPPCGQISCSLYGGQLNVLGMLENDGSSRVYGGLGLAYQDYSLEDDTDGTAVEGHGVGVSLIIGIAWMATPIFEPFFEIRLSALRNMRRQASGEVGFRITPGA
jgi:hypothetical protein